MYRSRDSNRTHTVKCSKMRSRTRYQTAANNITALHATVIWLGKILRIREEGNEGLFSKTYTYL